MNNFYFPYLNKIISIRRQIWIIYAHQSVIVNRHEPALCKRDTHFFDDVLSPALHTARRVDTVNKSIPHAPPCRDRPARWRIAADPHDYPRAFAHASAIPMNSFVADFRVPRDDDRDDLNVLASWQFGSDGAGRVLQPDLREPAARRHAGRAYAARAGRGRVADPRGAARYERESDPVVLVTGERSGWASCRCASPPPPTPTRWTSS